jgi:hypothetical protein
MKSSFFKKFALALLAVALLFVSNFTQAKLNVQRGKLGLTRVTPLDNAPPLLAFTTVALGGFRGLIANLLWIRANDLQQDEKFFEAYQLADWITKLQPHLATVWIHQAWNMSYNISVKFPDNRERWPWVKRAIELLRDDGLRYNPQEALIYRELAWIYQHKMGANLDNAHIFYKQTWSEEMARVIGPGKPNFDELLDPKTDEAKARVKILREQFKLDPQKMKDFDDKYGPLEWHLPESHAIYWAALGLEKSKPKDLITLRRVIYQSLDLASKRGRLIENKVDGIFEFGPNLDVIPKANFAYQEMIRDDPEFRENIGNGHRNFLKNAVASYYTHNRVADAQQLFNYMVQKYPEAARKDQDLDAFVLDYMTEEASEGGVDKYRAFIEGFIERSYYFVAIDQDDQGVGYELMARKLYLRHEEKVRRADRGRVDLPPYENIKDDIRKRILSLQIPGWSPALVAQLCTKMGWPMPKFQPANVTQGPGTPSVLDTTPPAERNRKEAEVFFEKNKKMPGVKVTSSGLQYLAITEGKGKMPSLTDVVRVYYRGTMLSGVEFDSSSRHGGVAEFAVNGVIKGWTEALQMMREGSHWKIFVPSDLAYGETGAGSFEPNTALIFEIELVEIKKK